jgi:hypothetical protein
MFCPKCGTEAADGASFCAKCGGPVGVAAKPADVVAPAPKKRLGFLGCVGVVTVVVFVLVGITVAIYVARQLSMSHGPDTIPSTAFIALADQKQHFGPSGEVITYGPSKPAYGKDGQGSGKPEMRPKEIPLPPSFTAPEAASSPKAEKAKIATTSPAPKAAAAKPKAATTKVASTGNHYAKSRHLTAALDPDWADYRSDKDSDNTPELYIADNGKLKSYLRIARRSCETPSFANYYPECKSHTAAAVFDVIVSVDDKIESFDCPVHAKPDDGCTAVWREKGADIIAAARALK